MKRFGKKLGTLTLAGAFMVSALAGCGTVKDTDIVAEVGDQQITAGVANFYARMQQAQYETYYTSFMGEDMWTQEIEDGVTYEDSTKESLLENLENMYILKAHLADYEVSLSEEEQTKIQETVKEFMEANALEDKNVISATDENIAEVLELLTYQVKMQSKMQEGVNEEVSDEEAAQKSMQYVFFSYTQDPETGEAAELTDDQKAELKKKAEDMHKKMSDAGNTDLEAAAAEAGVEVQTATFDSESTSPAAEIVQAADALGNEGDITEVIDTDYGCYIAKVTSFLDRSATDDKKTQIVNDRKTEQYNTLLDEWREDTKITEHDKVWEKISFEKQGVTMKQETEEPYSD